jgi:hypothetical protein
MHLPIHNIVNPISINSLAHPFVGLTLAEVIGELVVILIRVKEASQHELLLVVQAGDRLGFGLGLPKCGQEKTGQHGDNGNDNQEFNQGKGTASRLPLIPGNPDCLFDFHGAMVAPTIGTIQALSIKKSLLLSKLLNVGSRLLRVPVCKCLRFNRSEGDGHEWSMKNSLEKGPGISIHGV